MFIEICPSNGTRQEGSYADILIFQEASDLLELVSPSQICPVDPYSPYLHRLIESAGAYGPSSKLVVGALAIHLPGEGDETFGGGPQAFGAPWRVESLQILSS